jgi:uncharacterized membrane protein
LKILIYIFASIGGLAGAYVPAIFGNNNMLSGWSLLCGFVGTIIGIWVGYKVGQYIED